MATKIKDSATAEKAALKLNEGIDVPVKTGEQQAPKEKTTTEKLFPEFVTDDGAIVNRPVRVRGEAPQTLPAAETPKPEAQGQTPAPQAPTAPTYLKPDELAGKMVKLKVDGIEQDVPASDLIKLTQLERHSNAQLMKIAQERAQLEREKMDLQLRTSQTPAPKEKTEPPAKKAPEIEALESKMAAMEAAMAQERAMLLPQLQEAGIKRVEQMAKERIGSDDYRTYHDRIKEIANGEVLKAQASNDPAAARYFDSDAFYFQKYQEMKLKDMMAKPAVNPNPTAPVLEKPQGAPVVVTNSGQPVNIPSFEGSSGVPSRLSEQGDWQGTYNRLLQTAQQEPTDQNWMAVMRHKFGKG